MVRVGISGFPSIFASRVAFATPCTSAFSEGPVKIAPPFYSAWIWRKARNAERENDLPQNDGFFRKAGNCSFRKRRLCAEFAMVQCEQKTAQATRRIMCREEVGQSFQGRVRFLLRARLQHGNSSDRFVGAFSARWRRLGIFTVAPLAPLLDKLGHIFATPQIY